MIYQLSLCRLYCLPVFSWQCQCFVGQWPSEHFCFWFNWAETSLIRFLTSKANISSFIWTLDIWTSSSTVSSIYYTLFVWSMIKEKCETDQTVWLDMLTQSRSGMTTATALNCTFLRQSFLRVFSESSSYISKVCFLFKTFTKLAFKLFSSPIPNQRQMQNCFVLLSILKAFRG